VFLADKLQGSEAGSVSLYGTNQMMIQRTVSVFFLTVHLGFYGSYGYHADGLGLATVVLVPGWKDRLQLLKDENGKTVAQCLEPHDTAVRNR
jgi:hypothetical protein